LRGAYKAGLKPDPTSGHWPDTFKKPNHPTFSDQSMYATGENKAKAGRWEGEKFIPSSASDAAIPPPPWKQAGAQKPEASTIDSLWEGLKNFGSGVVRGAAGEGVPAGKASEDPGGRSEFGGRMVGAGARSVLDGLWDAIKTPGQVATGEKQPTVENALPTAMLMAGQGGRRPMVTEATGAPSAAARALRSQSGAGPNPFNPTGGGRVEPAPGVPAGGVARPSPPVQPQIRQQPTSVPIPGGAGQAMPPARPSAPAPAGGRVEPSISDATTSPLAQAIAGNDGAAVDRQLSRTYRGAVKPGRISQPSASGLATQDNRLLTAVDQIIANRSNLKLTNEAGIEIPQQLPRSLRQFSEAIDQTKGSIFKAYDQQARAAGQAGAQVPLAPVVAKLREIARSPEVVDLHPAVAADAERLAATMEGRGAYSPSEAQDVIQNLNKTLSGFWRNPTHETVSRASLLAPVSEMLRGQLDAAIESSAGPGYQQLRQRYGALRSIEKDVANAVQREAGKKSGGLVSGAANLVAGEEFLRGVFTMNPQAIGTAAAIKGAQMGWRYINNPNRAIGRMFERRVEKPLRQPYDRSAAAGAGLAGSIADQNDRGPMGGTIIGQRSIQRPAQGYPSP
jgi:hypothetical protein